MNSRFIEISLRRQTLTLHECDSVVASFLVSTAANGPGEEINSECTPRGRHEVDEKIGAGCIMNTVFVGRCATGDIYDDSLGKINPEKDWILTRILWLSGLESGLNKGGSVDSRARYIYIHGSPDSSTMGVPGSRGCIRMRNDDIVKLFELVEVGTPVNILN